MGWAHASNTPLKRYKQNTHGGGVRDPLIVHWPAGIAAPASAPQFHHVDRRAADGARTAGIDATGRHRRRAAAAPRRGEHDPHVRADGPATAKSVQYFEMFGHRGIWHDGWKAVAYHAPGSDFDADRWELYDLDHDVAECHDLAADQPDRLQDLIDLWWEEAERNQVLPLDDRIMERFLVPKPKPITDRRRFTYYDGAQVPSVAMPDIKDVSYSIVAELGDGGDGVIVSCGDRFSGFALHVVDGHPVHDLNCAGDHHAVRSSRPLPSGASLLEYRFTRTGELAGVGELLIDGEVCGRAEIAPTLRIHLSPAGLTIGRSPLSEVGEGYAWPARFSGRISRVIIEVDRDVGSAAVVPVLDD